MKIDDDLLIFSCLMCFTTNAGEFTATMKTDIRIVYLTKLFITIEIKIKDLYRTLIQPPWI